MSGPALLDTNILIRLFNQETGVKMRLAEVEEALVSAITIGELHFGCKRSARAAENTDRLEQFTLTTTILPVDAHTSRLYGEIKALLFDGGRPIPENDIWIAAHALQHDLTLITRDSHFAGIPELRLEIW